MNLKTKLNNLARKPLTNLNLSNWKLSFEVNIPNKLPALNNEEYIDMEGLNENFNIFLKKERKHYLREPCYVINFGNCHSKMKIININAMQPFRIYKHNSFMWDFVSFRCEFRFVFLIM